MSGTSCCGPGYASPAEAIKAPSEKLLSSTARSDCPDPMADSGGVRGTVHGCFGPCGADAV